MPTPTSSFCTDRTVPQLIPTISSASEKRLEREERFLSSSVRKQPFKQPWFWYTRFVSGVPFLSPPKTNSSSVLDFQLGSTWQLTSESVFSHELYFWLSLHSFPPLPPLCLVLWINQRTDLRLTSYLVPRQIMPRTSSQSEENCRNH